MTASAGAWYRVGTVNVVGGSQSIVGVGTNWQSDVIAIAIGDVFTLDAKTWYEVIAVDSDTSITLDRGFEGTTANGVDYAILRNTSGTILTRIAGQIAVQFNQKQLFLDELRNWLTSDDETTTLTDSHGISYAVKTLSKIQEITGTAATKDITTGNNERTKHALMKYGDWGIGEIIGPTGEVDLDLVPQGHYLTDQVILDGQPDYMAGGRKYAFTSERTAFFYQQLIQRDGDNEFAYRIASDKSQATDWVRLYTDKNSVNPLDYGFCLQNLSNYEYVKPDFSSVTATTKMRVFQLDGSAVGQPGTTRPVGLLQKGLISDRWCWSGVTDNSALEMYIANRDHTEPEKVLHTGNTNLDVFGGGAAGSIVLRGYMRTGGIARFMGNINSIEQPSGISVELTFDVHVGNSRVIAQGVTPIFSSEKSSNRLVVADVPGLNDTGTDADAEVLLVIAQDGAKIKVNY